MNDLFTIKGIPNNYKWGGFDYIPNLLGIDNSDQKPHGEYWLGAHPSAPSVAKLIGKPDQRLPDLIAEHKEGVLGRRVAEQFGKLPFLFKILDVREMLSIQVHPSKAGAEIGFSEENEKGISLTAVNRNYKDDNHKPELMYALSEFWLLHGFLSQEDAIKRLQTRTIYAPLLYLVETRGVQAAFEWAIAAPLEKTLKIIDPLLLSIKADKITDKNNPEYWIEKWTQKSDATKIGLLVILLMNVMRVDAGETVFQDAGIIHAYLEGQNIELMASSDNVLRGGLTEKHMDFEELFKHTTFETTIPERSKILPSRVSDHEVIFNTPIEDFILSEINIPEGETAVLQSTQLEIYLIMKGNCHVNSKETGMNLNVSKGESFASTPNISVEIQSTKESTRIFRARANIGNR